jgi:hypothetical protein
MYRGHISDNENDNNRGEGKRKFDRLEQISIEKPNRYYSGRNITSLLDYPKKIRYYRPDQFHVKHGSTACMMISLVGCYKFIKSGNPINLNWTSTVTRGASLWLLWKKETDDLNRCASFTDVRKLGVYQQFTNICNAKEDYGG